VAGRLCQSDDRYAGGSVKLYLDADVFDFLSALPGEMLVD
jgi:hypothetical protein